MSTSTANLRARIDALSSAIDRQNQVLRDLENERSSVRSELNLILDPMARLPLEISSDIFMHCLPSAPGPDPRSVPMVLLAVCHSWTNMALSTPSLWSTFHVECRPAQFGKILKAWLGRAQNAPLSLTFHVSLDQDVRVLLKQYADQVENLELRIGSEEELQQIIVPFPSLKTLTVVGFDPTTHRSDDVGLLLCGMECVKLLRAAPALMECDLLNLRYRLPRASNSELVTLPFLRRLCLAKIGLVGLDDGAGLLEYLTLPTLHSLLTAGYDAHGINFKAFLTRSSPPLRTLYLTTTAEDSGASYFGLVPGLTDLDMLTYLYDNFFVENLTRVDDFLPNLHNLTIRCPSPFSERSRFENVITMLSARRGSPLQSFRLLFQGIVDAPDADIILAFRQLAERGLQIHIGRKDLSYI
ncbi:hypothetical protein B0H11DRAFT_2015430 [Mycena galericulata]|nr:hypothetical protein B0H11DRAFT_2015430 [Mycena galericulata]